MMRQEDWTKQLRDRLADHQEAVPDDLWAGIEAGLSAPVRQRRAASSWRRWAAAAAVVLLVAGGWWLVDGQRSKVEGQRSKVEGQRSKVEGQRSKVDGQRSMVNLTRGQTPCEVTDEPQEKPKAETPSTAHVTTTEKTVAQPVPQSGETFTPRQPVPQPRETFTPSTKRSRDSRRLTAALYVGNGQYNGDDIARVQMSPNMAQKYYAVSAVSGVRSEEPIWLADYEERAHHERPFTLGLQLRYPLTERLSLTSGVVYTRQKSTFTKLMKGTEVEQQQRLHYIGLPLGLQYRLLQMGALHVYAAAGAQADWNVSARMGVNGLQADIGHDRLQWSLNGALGVACSLTPHVSLFAEPGVRHYLDNGSPLQNYFKDKPTSLSLRVGVQLNVGTK